MLKKSITILISSFLAFQSVAAFALEMPQDIGELVSYENISAKSYIVVDKASGSVLAAKNTDLLWPPASLAKLVTALVVLDTKPQLSRTVAMSKSDEVGGARLATKAGIRYRVGDLFQASLIASANNATNALARSTGLSKEEFAERMNQKARELGAEHTVFLEPTGIDEKNVSTVVDYAKIASTAFDNPYIRGIVTKQNYGFSATNSRRHYHNIKNTNKLLLDSDLTMIGGKTGYLDESQYNFATEVKDRFGNEIIVVLFGSGSSITQWQETKKLVNLGGLAKAFSLARAVISGTDAQGNLTSKSVNLFN